MGNMRVYGDYFKQLLFSNKFIKATTYDGMVIYIPVELLADVIHKTYFYVKDEKGKFTADGFTFTHTADGFTFTKEDK
jgi:hypothetical protein